MAFWKVLFHPEYTLLIGGDITSQAFPWLNVAAHWLKKGTLLLWDPYVYSGKANLGELQPGTLYPLYWPFMIPWTTGGGMSLAAMEALVIFHYFLAACFACYAARVFGISRSGSLLAGIGFALAGFTTQVYGFLNVFCGFVWMPLVLGFYRRSLEAGDWLRRAPWLAGAAVALTLSFLAGHHVPPIQTALLLLFYAAFVSLRRGREAGRWARLAPLVALASVGLAAGCLAALQWLPSLEWGRLAYRWVSEGPPLRWGEKIPYSILEKTGTVSPQDAASLLFPHLSVDMNLYAGAPFLVLALAGALLARAAEARLFALLAAVYFLTSWGPLSALHGWLNTFVPGLWFAREIFHYLLPMQLCLALLAGWGIDALAVADAAADEAAVSRFAGRAAVASTVAVAGCGALIVVLHTVRGVDVASAYIRSAAALATYAALVGALLYFLDAGRISRARFATLAVALVFVDLASHVSSGVRTRERPRAATDPAVHSFWKLPPAAAFLKDERKREIFRVDDAAASFPPNFGDGWLLEATMGHGATALVRYLDFRGVGWGPGSNASALLNASFFTSPVPIAGMKEVFAGPAPIYRNPRAVPRVFATATYRAFESDDAMLAWMKTPLFSPSETVLLRRSDLERLPPSVRGQLRSEDDGIAVTVEGFEAAADRKMKGTADAAERNRVDAFRSPWGWSDGDELSVTLRPAERLERCYIDVRHFPPASGPAYLEWRLGGKTNPIFLAPHNVSPEPDFIREVATHAIHPLGPLEAGERRLDFRVVGPARIDAIQFSKTRQEDAVRGRVRVISHTPNRIVLDAVVERPALVVASEIFYPGWEAAVDGRPAPLLEADYILRAVPVESGRHTIVMRFRPASFRIGLALTLTAAAAIAMALFSRRRRVAA